jgi:hypothetical protein
MLHRAKFIQKGLEASSRHLLVTRFTLTMGCRCLTVPCMIPSDLRNTVLTATGEGLRGTTELFAIRVLTVVALLWFFLRVKRSKGQSAGVKS